ncbi:hypothetical protein NDU88_000480 [Pleurodeles waltl]|uniref:Uncharacterized protein n=1 Tax=Pleurodeles waltl TaxID=8319 RepID=A0AAV7MKZ3_PLEWA|nr:hypothetical protein NDU88_000480 [Pleurodeles waltl]
MSRGRHYGEQPRLYGLTGESTSALAPGHTLLELARPGREKGKQDPGLETVMESQEREPRKRLEAGAPGRAPEVKGPHEESSQAITGRRDRGGDKEGPALTPTQPQK